MSRKDIKVSSELGKVTGAIVSSDPIPRDLARQERMAISRLKSFWDMPERTEELTAVDLVNSPDEELDDLLAEHFTEDELFDIESETDALLQSTVTAVRDDDDKREVSRRRSFPQGVPTALAACLAIAFFDGRSVQPGQAVYSPGSVGEPPIMALEPSYTHRFGQFLDGDGRELLHMPGADTYPTYMTELSTKVIVSKMIEKEIGSERAILSLGLPIRKRSDVPELLRDKISDHPNGWKLEMSARDTKLVFFSVTLPKDSNPYDEAERLNIRNEDVMEIFEEVAARCADMINPKRIDVGHTVQGMKKTQGEETILAEVSIIMDDPGVEPNTCRDNQRKRSVVRVEPQASFNIETTASLAGNPLPLLSKASMSVEGN